MERYFAAGVLKVDGARAGFERLKTVAHQWAADPCFREIVVRKVSETDFGIQFVYFAAGGEGKRLSHYEHDLRKHFSEIKGIDVCERTTNDPLENILDGVIRLAEFTGH